MSLTPEQLKVIANRQRTIFVEAGAGTGKTTLLVECYLSGLLDDGLTPEQLPTVTFTRKAAGEMRERIRRALLDRGASSLARRVQDAPIGTIDSFAARILRDNALEAGLDPAFGILEEERAAMLVRQAFRDVWERHICALDDERLTGLSRFQKEVEGGVISLYARLRGAGREDPRLRLPVTPASGPAENALRGALRALLDAGIDRVKASARMLENLDKAEACVEWLDRSASHAPEQRIVELRRFRPNAGCGNAEQKALIKAVQEESERLHAVLGEQLLAPLAGEVDELLAALHSEYVKRKKDLGVLDFLDLTLEARSLLERGLGGLEPGSRLIVDEFQDTNDLQCAFFDALGAEAILTVGDQFQSIYGFRNADVEVFRDRKRETPADSVFTLSTNFRSRQRVLDVVNWVFRDEAILGPELLELTSGREPGEPRPGRTEPRGSLGPAAELVVLEKEAGADWREQEARASAECVARLVRAEGWKQRDVVMLFHSTRGIDTYADELEKRGLDAYVVGGRNYYASEEVGDVLSILSLLINPHDDLALLTVLRSPFVGVADDVLYLLREKAGRRRSAGRRPFLWTALLAVAKGQELPGATEDEVASLRDLVAGVFELRGRLGTPGLGGFIEQVLNRFDYDLAVLRAPQGRRRFANLRKLMRLADEFESVEGPDPASLVAYLRERGELAAKEGNAAILAEGENVVRLMTIHQAKGLEFPVVLVVGLGSEGGGRGGAGVHVGLRGQVGFRFKLEEGPGSPTVDYGPVEETIEEASRREGGELLRKAYVAFTRAEERLVLVGTRGITGTALLHYLEGLFDVRPAPDPEAPGLRAAPGSPAAADGKETLGVAASEGDGFYPWEGIDLRVRSVAEVPTEDALMRPTHAPPVRGTAAPRPPAFVDWLAPKAPVKSVSFSSLSLYLACPRRYFLESVLGLGEFDVRGGAAAERAAAEAHPEPDDGAGGRGLVGEPGADEAGGVSGREVGVVVHQMLEEAELAAAEPGEAALAHLAARALERHGLTGEPRIAQTSVRLAHAFWQSPVATHPGLAAGQKEVPFVFAHRGFLVRGIFDLFLEESRGGWHILDYKTNRLGEGGPAEAVKHYRLQAAIYALAALRAGREQVRVSFLFLEQPGELVTYEFAASDRGALEEELSAALAGIENGDFAAREDHCDWCSVEGLCGPLGVDGPGSSVGGNIAARGA